MRTQKTCGDCMWLYFDKEGSCWEYCKGRYRPMCKNNIYITGKCRECGNIQKVCYRFRDGTICKKCFEEYGVLINVQPILKEDANKLFYPPLVEDCVEWTEG